jgi:uncharacterized protein (DUF1697 family)
MAELRAALADDGFDHVRTSIASGNIVVRGETCEPERVGRVIAERFGLDVPVIVRSADRFRAAVAANPFPEATDDPTRLSCCFAPDPVADDALADFDHERYAPDRLAVAAGELYAHYPDGVARSTLTSAVLDRVAGGPVTARNWNTVLRLADLVAAAEAAD